MPSTASLSATTTTTTTTTIPSDPTIDTSIPPERPPPRPQSSSTSLQRLVLLLRQYMTTLAHTTDANILRFSNLLSTPSGTDALLCTVGYTLDLLSTLISQYLSQNLISAATPTLRSSRTTNPIDHHVVLPPPHMQTLSRMRTCSKALASTISDYRIFVRLWGLFGIYTWARSTYLTPSLPSAASRGERALRAITWTQVVAGVAFQVLENGAYLASKGAIWTSSDGDDAAGSSSKTREAAWWIWSSRFWAAHVGLELVRLYLQSRSTSRSGAGAGAALTRAAVSSEKDGIEAAADGEKEYKILREEQKREDWLWWRDAVSNAAYAPMTLHWSVEEGLLSELGVGILGTVAGGALLVDKWRETR
ncbi:hypothetical protein K504DRAFT_460033 [Pleomassaria siparia CBS 279.74]|uniref:Peroxin 11C n=1 Tax=Pleomassaria siparia CBS 279.74 TaxID=1314801 RepID=A0A6G1K0G7_9PLEO|nr:hypothetical protein K504DRAFT_460033 [Pleomassaria siparia CBS 279.74]